jgi:hypothetical protein
MDHAFGSATPEANSGFTYAYWKDSDATLFVGNYCRRVDLPGPDRKSRMDRPYQRGGSGMGLGQRALGHLEYK